MELVSDGLRGFTIRFAQVSISALNVGAFTPLIRSSFRTSAPDTFRAVPKNNKQPKQIEKNVTTQRTKISKIKQVLGRLVGRMGKGNRGLGKKGGDSELFLISVTRGYSEKLSQSTMKAFSLPTVQLDIQHTPFIRLEVSTKQLIRLSGHGTRGVFKSNLANMSDAYLRGAAKNSPLPGQTNYNKRLRTL